jgi:hypothetical protein
LCRGAARRGASLQDEAGLRTLGRGAAARCEGRPARAAGQK